MAEEERGPRRAVQTTVTTRFEPLLAKLRDDEWSSSGRADDSDVVTTAEPLGPADVLESPPVEKPRISKVIRFDASSVDRGFVAARGTQVGKYVLEDKLGQGTFGSVYTAKDTELERRVAFKVLNPSHQTNVDVVTRFLQEARATARINHVGIVTILDVGRVPTDLGDLAYIVMELLEGETLSRRIDKVGRMQPADAIEICHQIAGALGAAHKAEVLHRDVKPDNIFLVRDPVLASGERVKVLDFGLAKLGRGGHTLANTILGTPRYMSPEQTRSSTHIDKRSDVYSLGCILFELLVGRRPFEGDLATLIERHQRETPQRVKTIVPAVPKSLDELVARMLAKAPAARPQSMEEVQKELLATAALDRKEGPQVGRSSVDQSLARPAPKAEAKPEAKPKPEKAKAKPLPEVDEPKVEIDPELTKEAQAYTDSSTESSIDDLPKQPTRVAFPPPPPPPELESITATAPGGDASGQTMILDSRRRGKRRRSLPLIAGVTFALAFVAVATIVVIGRFVSDEGDGAVTRPGFAPTRTAEPAKPPPAEVETAKPEPAQPTAPAQPTEPEIAIEAEPAADPAPTAAAPTPAKVRKRPPVVRAAPPVRKKPVVKQPPTWDPNALFPKKPTASR